MLVEKACDEAHICVSLAWPSRLYFAALDCSARCPYNNAIAQTLAGQTMRFTDTKSETLNLRVSPTFKQVLKQAADREQRSMVNMLEVLLSDYCDRKGIVLPGKDHKTHPGHKGARTGRKALVGGAA